MMQRYSLRLRLVGFAILIVVGAMVATWAGLTLLFERNIERLEGQRLDTHLERIIGGLRIQPDESVVLSRELSDPRFGAVFGGLYFQVATLEGEVILKSRSLWDTEIGLPDDVHAPGDIIAYERSGPNNTTLLIHESRINFVGRGKSLPLIVTVGIDKAELIALRAGFSRDLVLALAALAVVLLLGFAFQISVGLRPLDRLRKGISDVRSGQTKRLPTNAPSEVRPLIEEVNTLLDLQDENMVRARDRAADMAHGLKTPLTALGTDIARLRKIGADDIADDIEEISARMRRHLDRELALARDRHGRDNASTAGRSAIDSIIRALEKTPQGERLNYHNNVQEWVNLAVDQGDFLEIAGNLLENAVKFASSSISVDCEVRDGWASINISDDGQGVAATKISHIAKRGVRLDTSEAGSGLGLAIVKDLVEVYRGLLVLNNRPEGGLSVILTLPVASTSPPTTPE